MKLKEVSLNSIWTSVFIGVFILFSQCTDIDFDSRNFNRFLNQFDTSIAEEEHYYIILSKYTCQSCAHHYLELFLDKNVLLPRSTTTFILSNNKTYSALEDDTFAILHDRERSIEQLSFNITEFALLKTSKKRIIQRWNFSSSEEGGYIEFLDKEFGEK